MPEICEDVREECSKFGTVLDLKIPRLAGGSRQSAGVGKIFVKFDTPESTTKALKALAGRKFADRTVVTTYFPEVCSCNQNLKLTLLTRHFRKISMSALGSISYRIGHVSVTE